MAASRRYIKSFHFFLLKSSINRSICTCSVLNLDPTKSKTMQKLMNKSNRKKDTKWFSPTFTQVQREDSLIFSAPVKPRKKVSEGRQRRAAQLSTILYENISQVIGIGELGMYVEVTKVSVVPDMSSVNVYWEASGEAEQDKETQKQLEARAGQLRHALLTSHALGNIPRIVFVKDLSSVRQKVFDELLKSVDLGPEYILNDQGQWEYVETASDGGDDCDTDTEVTAEGDNRTSQIDDTEESEEQFRQNIYGLQHDVIMKKVMDARLSSRQRPHVSRDGDEDFTSRNQVSVKKLSQFFRHQKRKDLRTVREDNDEFIDDEYDCDDSDTDTSNKDL